MSGWQDWRETAADRALIRSWQRAGAMVSGASGEGPDDAGPPPALWRAFLDRFALWLGVALCAAGAVCFVAANWEHLGKLARFAGLQTALVLAAAIAFRLGLARRGGQAALWLATILLGALLALIGQTYQTGADTWELFALWTALALPWTVAARNAAQWLTWALLLNLAVGLWLGLHPNDLLFYGDRAATTLGLLDLGLLALHEAGGRRWPEFAGTFARRLLAVAAVALLSLAAMHEILDSRAPDFLPPIGVASLVWAAATAALLVFAVQLRRDLPIVAALALGIIAVSTSFLVEILFDGPERAAYFLLIALAVLAQAALAAFALRRLARGEAA